MSESEKRPAEDLVKGLFSGLQSVIESVQHLAISKADQVRKGVFPSGTGLHGVYGFTIRADLGKPALVVEPFGNVRRGESGEAVVTEYVEPRVEVGEDAGAFVITAEMPGVGPEDVHLSVFGSTLTITAERGKRKYRKEIPLPPAANVETMLHAHRDGVLEVRFGRLPQPEIPPGNINPAI
ncbi:MAG: Hsp20/alpha crystallin family protein [Gemmataceae bacterium]